MREYVLCYVRPGPTLNLSNLLCSSVMHGEFANEHLDGERSKANTSKAVQCLYTSYTYLLIAVLYSERTP